MRVSKRALAALTLALLLILPAGCQARPFLTDVTVRPAVISPNADGVSDIAEITYSLSRQSTISIYVVDAEGNRHPFREGQRRSRGGRAALFGGVINDRLLPDGSYTVRFEAVDERGRINTAEVPLTISDGDPVPLEIQGLSIWPNVFTPNRDGITDRVSIGYTLNKEAARVEVYLVGEDGIKYPVPEDKIREVGAPGPHEHDYDAGVDLGATPPPDGDYTVVVEADDAVGNRARVSGQLTISQGGVPQVVIVNGAAVFEPSVVALGGTITFTCTVKNEGRVPVRTRGPEPGTTYTTSENYNTLGEYEEPGIFRIGLDYEGNTSGRSYPFRWQLGMDDELTTVNTAQGPQQYLMPGQTVTVVGHLQVVDPPVVTEPYYWIGLLHEQVWVVQDRVEPTQISVGF
ncbi:MAG: hypothetical protein GXY68_12850 [Chloroflexi bacterium]|jgi:hypothetical protein|nr:hypothetical protein [Chloroflexota bacterium]